MGRRQNTHAEPYSGLSHYEASRHIFTTICIFIMMVACFTGSCNAARNEFLVPTNIGCVCPGTDLVYTCTAVGSGNTQWRGTLFECTSNRIILRHDRYASGGVSGDCNDNTVVAQSVGVENSCYTSQLVFTVISAYSNRTVSCLHNSNVGISTIGSSVITVTEGPLPPPNNISLVRVEEGVLTFSWSSYGPECTSVFYGISSNCGSCPNSTYATSVNCSVLEQLLSSDIELTCSFSVHSEICGYVGQLSDPVVVTLKVPDAPSVIIVPTYSYDDPNTLIGFVFVINQPPPFIFADGLNGTVKSYNIQWNSNETVLNSTCVEMDDECEYSVESDVAVALCDSSSSASNINITVSATNELGYGPPSERTVVECTNRFVEVLYSDAPLIITCKFLNQLDSSEKSCSFHFGLCDQSPKETTSGNTKTDAVTLYPSRPRAENSFCVTASNNSYSIRVEGEIEFGPSSSSSVITPIIVAFVVFGILIVVILVILVVIVSFGRRKNAYRPYDSDSVDLQEHKKIFTDKDLEELIDKQKEVDPNLCVIESHDVEENCALKHIIKKNGWSLEKGRIYYEFTRSEEDVSEDSQLLFKKTDTEKYFCLNVDGEVLRKKNLVGENVLKPSLTGYKVFVQVAGSEGSRHLAQDTTVLYEKKRRHPLWHVKSDHYKTEKLGNKCTLKEFCNKPGRTVNKSTILLEVGNHTFKENLDVILMEEGCHREPKTLLTGPNAHVAVEKNAERKKKDSPIDIKRYRVLVQSEYEDNRELEEGTWILYKPTEQDVELPLFKGVTLILIETHQFKYVKLDKECKLEDFRKKHNLDSDCNVLVAMDRKEWIKQDVLDVVLMNEETNEFFTVPMWRHKLKLGTAEQKAVDDSSWRVFIMRDFEKGMKIKKNSLVLYLVNDIQWEPSGLLPIYNLSVKETKSDYKLTDICKKYKDSDVFVDFDGFPQDKPLAIRDVILMDKNTQTFFTGPRARYLVQQRINKAQVMQDRDVSRWTMYVLSSNDNAKDFVFTTGTSILFQRHKQLSSERFEVIKVNEDNVCLSEFFTKNRPNYVFENGNAFFEFNGKEDILFYKEVVVMEKGWHFKFPEKGERDCKYKSFYAISDQAPGTEIKSPSNLQNKWFVQSTAHGSRCLKKGTLLLYRKSQIKSLTEHQHFEQSV